MGERCPQNIQNLVLRDYCLKKSYEYLLSGAEYAMKDSYLMLKQVIEEIPNIDGVLAYSLFQMPENRKKRLSFYEKIIKKNGEIHFALEDIVITSHNDIDKAENIWLVRQAMPNCPSQL
ncbi:MAG: sporadic carbohydrate cluster protein, LIC12192 family [Gammaproteobacteria bacterium]|nr:sporadic carbohydrate cluster protein, LIC12192 family [Gammaproteobacteria bacterium]